jgi:hypothetical protein
MNNIIDPSDNQAYSIHSKNGKRLLKNYIKFYNDNMNTQTGGMQWVKNTWKAGKTKIAEVCGLNDTTCEEEQQQQEEEQKKKEEEEEKEEEAVDSSSNTGAFITVTHKGVTSEPYYLERGKQQQQEEQPQQEEQQEQQEQRQAEEEVESSDESYRSLEVTELYDPTNNLRTQQRTQQPKPQQTREQKRKETYNKTLSKLRNIHTAIKQIVGNDLGYILSYFEFINESGNIINRNEYLYGQKMYLSESESKKGGLESIHIPLYNKNERVGKHITGLDHVSLIVEVINEIYMIFKGHYTLFVSTEYNGPNTGTNFNETNKQAEERINDELSTHDQFLKQIFLSGRFVDNQYNLEYDRLSKVELIIGLNDYIPEDPFKFNISDFIFFNDEKIQKRNISRQQARHAAKQSQKREEDEEQNDETKIRVNDKDTRLKEINTYIATLTTHNEKLQPLIKQLNARLSLENIQQWTADVNNLGIEQDLQKAQVAIDNAEGFIKKYYQTGGKGEDIINIKDPRLGITGTTERAEETVQIRKDKRLQNLNKRRAARQAETKRQEAQDELITRVERLQTEIQIKINELKEEYNKVSSAHVTFTKK